MVLYNVIRMRYRNWKQQKNKDYSAKSQTKSSRRDGTHKDDIKSAFKDEEDLKRKKKRLTIDWFFRPEGD